MNTKSKKGKKKIITAISILVIIAASAVAIPHYVSAKNNTQSENSDSVTRTVEVGTQDLRKVISSSGQIMTGDAETLTLDADKEVNEVLVEEGQAVKEGHTLVTYTDDTELDSPFDGVVGTISIDTTSSSSSSKTATGSAENTITINSTETLTTELAVDETDLQYIKDGQAAEITVNALPDVQYTGKVTKISATGTYSNGSSTFDVTITLDKNDNVKIGMSADVEIVIASVEDAVAVPIEAVQGSGDNARVMVVQSDGTVTPVNVELGLATDAYVQITSGLVAGDKIQYTVQTSNSSRNTSGFGALGGMSGFSGGNMSGANGNRQQRQSSQQQGTGNMPQ